MSSQKITRRLLRGLGASLGSRALASPYINNDAKKETPNLPIDPLQVKYNNARRLIDSIGESLKYFDRGVQYLIREKHKSLEQAILELDGLKDFQIVGIIDGLEKYEVLRLKGEIEIAAFRQLKKFGASLEAINGMDLTWPQLHALYNLTAERGDKSLSFQKAVAEIAALDELALNGIKNGLSRKEAIYWTESQQYAIRHLGYLGITSAHLCDKNYAIAEQIRRADSHSDLKAYVDALAFLIEKQKLQPDQAMAKFGLLDSAKIYPSPGHAHAVSQGVPFDLAKHLNSRYEAEAFIKFKNQGLKVTDFVGSNFNDNSCIVALDRLTSPNEKYKFAFKSALLILDQLNHKEILSIAQDTPCEKVLEVIEKYSKEKEEEIISSYTIGGCFMR